MRWIFSCQRRQLATSNANLSPWPPLGLAKTKQQDFFFVSPFVLLLAYASTMILCLCLWRSLCRRLDFIPLFCLLFCLYAYRVNQAFICLRLWRSLGRRFDFIPLFCLLFCLYAYANARVWTRLKNRMRKINMFELWRFRGRFTGQLKSLVYSELSEQVSYFIQRFIK